MAKKTKSKKRGVLSHRHAFNFKLENGSVIKAWATVRPAKRPVVLTLTKEHVQKSLALGGQGNTQNCAMAVCSREHGDKFPHAFHFVDWLYKRAYFVTKTRDGLPSECVVYTHHDSIAPLFDTKAGTKELLKAIERDGEKTINLYPPTIATRTDKRPRGAGTSKPRTISPKKGAALRFYRLQLGGVAA
jgi:hypothetical protein